MVDEFTRRRLEQLKPIGAIMSTRAFGKTPVWVSSIKFGDGIWTRVQDHDQKVMRHYPGNLTNEAAAARFRNEFERIEA